MSENEGSLEHKLRNRAVAISKAMDSAHKDIKRLLDFAEDYCPESLPLENIQFLRQVLLTNLPKDANTIMEVCDKLTGVNGQDAKT